MDYEINEKTGSSILRNKRVVFAAVIILFLLVAVAAVWFWSAKSSKKSAVNANQAEAVNGQETPTSLPVGSEQNNNSVSAPAGNLNSVLKPEPENNEAVVTAADVNQPDTDGDGLIDQLEKVLGTDPLKSDTDGDGYSDYQEISNGYNPLGPGKRDFSF